MKLVSTVSGGVLTVLVTLLWSARIALGLPDTGITKCYDDTGTEIPCPKEGQPFYGQDANFGPGLKLFTNNNDGTITHVDSGLMWEVKGGAGELNDADATYTWEKAQDFILLLNAKKFGGYSDWRLPTIKELGFMADYSTTPAINLSYFPNCRCVPYWSSTPYAQDTGAAWYWYFDFGNGTSSPAARLESFRVRAVRNGDTP